ncbi:RYamide receptor [Magallana gigas]|uniref:RYamide receptor n=1 Tax=Magallana gigas TaxID=29159 RepID=UPI0005C37AA4|eukprot:XP_011424174.1 PREDICTED: substance-K receptor [Crassostrea gigas]
MESTNGENFTANISFYFTCLNGTLNMSKLCNDSGINSFPSTIHSDDEDKLSIDALIGLIFLYAITTFLSLGGNILVVLVFVKGRRSRTDLRLFLINLAASDLIMAAFCMPFTFADSIMGYWVFTAPLCPIVLFFQIFSVCGSVFTNVAIGIDRFMAVSFPLHSRITYRRGKYVIALVWLCAFALSAVQFFIGRSSIYKGRVICNEEWPHPSSRPLYTVFVMILTYMFPLLILLLTYTVVGIMLWKRTAPGNKHYERDRHQLRSKIKVVKMLVIVVVMFGICWLPLHLFNLMGDFTEVFKDVPHQQKLALFLGAHWLAMSNSFANPIIYGFTNETFRADLVVLMHNWFPWSHCLRNLMIRTYSLSTYDSVIYRRTTMLNRQTSFNNNSCSSKSLKATTTLNGSARPMRKLHRVGTEVRTNKSNIPVRKFSSIQYKHRLPSSDEQP